MLPFFNQQQQTRQWRAPWVVDDNLELLGTRFRAAPEKHNTHSSLLTRLNVFRSSNLGVFRVFLPCITFLFTFCALSHKDCPLLFFLRRVIENGVVFLNFATALYEFYLY